MHLLLGDGVDEVELPRVKSASVDEGLDVSGRDVEPTRFAGFAVIRAYASIGARQAFAGAVIKRLSIGVVAEKRMPDMAHVNPDLMGATSFELQLDQGKSLGVFCVAL